MPAPDPALQAALRLALAALFAVAALHKARDAEAFRAALAGYRLLPVRALGAVARALPAAEFGLALALLVPRTGRIAAASGAALLALYSGAVALNLLRGRRRIDCGCGGVARPLSAGLLARNAVLVAAAGVAALAPAARPFVWIDALTAVGGAVALALLYAAAETLAAPPRWAPTGGEPWSTP